MQEQELLCAAAVSRDAAMQMETFNAESDFSTLAKVIFKEILTFYKTDEKAKCINKKVILSRLKRRYPKESHYQQYESIVNNLRAISVPNVLAELRALRLNQVSNKLAKAAFDLEYKEVDELIERYESLRAGEESELIGKLFSGPHIYKEENTGSLDQIHILPPALDQMLEGKLGRQNHVAIFARPDIGKTAFLINAVAGFIKQKYKVLYICNEEPHRSITYRLKSRMTQQDVSQVEANESKYTNFLKARGYEEYFFLYEVEDGTKSDIQAIVEKIKPDVLIVDQLRSVRVRADAQAAGYEILARFMRSTAKRYNLLSISVLQAGATAEGKAKLEMTDLDGSKTGVAGTCDLMIGIGATEQMKRQNQIMLHCPKDKVSGAHGSTVVRLDPRRSKLY